VFHRLSPPGFLPPLAKQRDGVVEPRVVDRRRKAQVVEAAH
jgi:hypothetical protein